MSARSRRLEAEIDAIHGAGYYRREMRQATRTAALHGTLAGLASGFIVALVSVIARGIS